MIGIFNDEIESINVKVIPDPPINIQILDNVGPQGEKGDTGPQGEKIELRVYETILQYKYENDETWQNLINFQNINYEMLQNLPTINGVEIKGEIDNILLTSDIATDNEVILMLQEIGLS